MFSSFFKQFFYLFLFIFIITIFISCFSSIILISSQNYSTINLNDDSYLWPLPQYTYISSHFGFRNSPTLGASTYHSGIDIPAPEDTPILSICSGKVTFASWGAGGGYTIVITNDVLNISVSYCHLSPTFIVIIGCQIKKGDTIAHVGPKNVYNIINNPYHDSNGNPTNGATTGCHLHLTIKKDGYAVNPLDYIHN